MTLSQNKQLYFKSMFQKWSEFIGNELVMNQKKILKRNKNILSIVLFMTFVAFLCI